jgi:hypothetical protein
MISHKWILYSCLAWLFILPTDMVMYPKVDVDKEANLGVTSTNDGKIGSQLRDIIWGSRMFSQWNSSPEVKSGAGESYTSILWPS